MTSGRTDPLSDEFGPDRLELRCGTETLIIGHTGNRLVVGIATKSLNAGHSHVPYATTHSLEVAAKVRDYLDKIVRNHE